MPSSSPKVVWFRNDLRVHDNPALAAACAGGGAVIALYILDDETPGVRSPGGASRWWLHHSLLGLERGLSKLSIPLVLRRGAAGPALQEVVGLSGAGGVCWNRRYDPGGIACDTAIKSSLLDAGVNAESFNGNLLTEPSRVKTGQGSPYRVFTPFWRAARHQISNDAPLPVPGGRREQWRGAAGNQALNDWRLLPGKPDWAAGLKETWVPGEAAARERLEAFLDERLRGYGAARDVPSTAGTSLLSPHLRFGEISPRSIWHAVQHCVGKDESLRPDGEKFLSELGWREFSHHLLFHFPDIGSDNHNARFDGFDWRDDDDALSQWQQGLTGYPVVDAGMRELWATGYMHNRVRMITASFLTKHLRLHWRAGEAWFWDTLVDADIASNVANWQWVAGTGADAAPYFRIFNPILQGEKFDPRGDYVRKWVPELASTPNKYVHKPWEARQIHLTLAGGDPGTAYPAPIVDHREARAAALDAFRSLKDA